MYHAWGASMLIVDDIDGLVEAAKAMALKAMHKYPQPNYVISKFAEESGEVVKAAIHHAEGRDTREHVIAEMVDALAILFRLAADGDQVHKFQPVLSWHSATDNKGKIKKLGPPNQGTAGRMVKPALSNPLAITITLDMDELNLLDELSLVAGTKPVTKEKAARAILLAGMQSWRLCRAGITDDLPTMHDYLENK